MSDRMIDVILLDIDGVLTDGTILVGPTGEEWKRIAFDDIDGVFRLKRAGLKVGFITGESTPFCDYVARRFAPDFFERGCKNKVGAFERIQSESQIPAERFAFVGDSMHDVPLLRAVSHSFAPADAPASVRAAAKTVLTAKRGQGVILNVADILIDGVKEG